VDQADIEADYEAKRQIWRSIRRLEEVIEALQSQIEALTNKAAQSPNEGPYNEARR
jgi:prefoldin subunit 5